MHVTASHQRLNANQILNSVQIAFRPRYAIAFQPVLSRSAPAARKKTAGRGERSGISDVIGKEMAGQAALQSSEPASAPCTESDDDDADEGDRE